MSAVFGILCLDGTPVAQRDLERMGAALHYRGPDGLRAEALGEAGLGHCLMRVHREDRFEAQPLFDDEAGLALVADCRIDNRAALAATFGWDTELERIPDSAFILEACKRWGERAPERLLGDFVFALWNSRSRTLLLARDPMGQRHVHYHRGAGVFAFATDLAGLWPLEAVPQRLDPAAIGRRLLGDWRGNIGGTFYDGVEALGGGVMLTIRAGGELERRAYWAPAADPAHLGHDEAYYVRTWRSLLEQAVACRVGRLLSPPALSFSGGIDSGAIAALAGPALGAHGQRLIAVTSVASEPGGTKDARAAAEACARWMPHLDLHFYARRDETAFDALETGFAQEGAPFPTNPVLRGIAGAARARGARLFIDGHGGDYTINFRGPLDWRPWLRQGRLRRIWREANAVARASGQWRLGALLGLALPRLLPDRALDAWLAARRGFRPRWHQGVIAPGHAHALIASGDADADAVRGTWRHRGRNRTWMLRTIEAQRSAATPPHAVTAGLLGLQLTRPYHDPRIIAFALAIPEDLFFRNGRFRHLARQALAELMPPELLRGNRANDAYAPDFTAMRRAQLEEARRETARMARDPELAAMIDFARVERLLVMAEATPDAPPDNDAPAVQAIAAARFVEWSRKRNAAPGQTDE